jgi:hypothetical protein
MVLLVTNRRRQYGGNWCKVGWKYRDIVARFVAYSLSVIHQAI